ncbi:hypothetical protein [Cohnella nanjingensis]|uniref:DUF4179 domain-containing protein n=1 Tax=Cohnella nanjingensis TaxID=1387779 RepID=A0A7X0RVQ2_9BACL|nr:hypothetical protein [Cohnella nanjingensis]MBB6673351.1 hypothetical protein [Cohnella nanjingensis]
MSDHEKWDGLFRQALASAAEPDEQLNQSILNRFKERKAGKRVYRKRLSAAALVALLALVMSVTAFAAAKLYSAQQVAEHLGERSLAKAFDSADAVSINQSIVSGGYNFTLHGIVSGAGLKELEGSANDINPDRTYAVVSVARQDGNPMPGTSDTEYGKEPFFISPLIKGLKPWQVNIVTMNGGYSETVLDGVMYRLIECDGVEMFADRGVYLAISSGDRFFNKAAFDYDERTGVVTPRADYDGVSLLFDLPLDQAKADPAKAEAYLQQLLKEPSSGAAAVPAASNDAEANLANQIEDLREKIPYGQVIPESVQEVTYDDKGSIRYDYDGWSATLAVDQLFAEGQTGDTDAVQFSGDGKKFKALVFSRDDKGVITGRVIELK